MGVACLKPFRRIAERSFAFNPVSCQHGSPIPGSFVKAMHTHGLETATFLASSFSLMRSFPVGGCLLEGDEGLITVVLVRIVEEIEVCVCRRLGFLVYIVGV